MNKTKPEDLNYHHYTTKKYDVDIERIVPGHKAMHSIIDSLTKDQNFQQVLDVGIGTGVTSEVILKNNPSAKLFGYDWSSTMLYGAREKLKGYNVDLYCEDYAKAEFPKENDAVVSVISIHHQETDEDKRDLFQRIYNSLNERGVFIFGDLVTYRNPVEGALNEAQHFHYLVENAQDEESLKEWAHHHKHLNKLAPLEDQVEWLREVGFRKATVLFQKYNTALLYAKK